MSSNPARRVAKPVIQVDDKYLKEMDKKIKAMQDLAKVINAGKSYEQVVSEASTLRADIEKRKGEVIAAEHERQRILDEAAKAVRLQMASTQAEIDSIIADAKEARNKIVRDAGTTLAKAQRTEKELHDALTDVVAKKLVAETKALELQEMINRQNVQWQRIDDTKKILEQREIEVEKKSDEVRYTEQKADEDWASARLAIDGLKLREKEIAEREAVAQDNFLKGKALVQQADSMFKEITARKAAVETKEYELKNLETRLEVATKEFNSRENAISLRERDVEYRDKECQIRESQIRAKRL